MLALEGLPVYGGANCKLKRKIGKKRKGKEKR
jgi:hypothetical protein